jgi:hypothetical protein
MITTHNYYNSIASIDFAALPTALQKGNEFVEKATSKGKSWDVYTASDAIKKTIDLYLEKLNEFVNNTKAATHKQVRKQREQDDSKTVIKEAMRRQGINPKAAAKNTNTTEQKNINFVERIPEEIRFIKRFVNLNGKTKTKDDLLRFINSLQKAIVEKRIRKTSVFAEEIKMVQSKLIDTYNTMGNKIAIELTQSTYENLKELTGAEKVMPSIQFIKKYIAMNGKISMKQKAKDLLEQINKALDKGKLKDSDFYINEIHELKKNLKTFISTTGQKTLSIEPAALNGLEGILGCACQQLNGVSTPQIMNSMDFAKMEFDTIGLQGKWLQLIGDPSSNFTAMVYGKPKMGKSYLCIDFAGYLARNHGKVLYVAKEEGLDYTLQMKLNDKNVKHPNLYVSSILPTNLSQYDFIFLDSVNKLGLTPEDLNRLKSFNPNKSFVFIFQTTKQGNFRGENVFQHDVDIVIEIPEKGKAVQMGRFNQGGEMRIF